MPRIMMMLLAMAITLPLPSTSFSMPVIVVLGDSLSAGYGLSQEQAFPAQLEAALQASYPSIKVINESISGDTTAGGLQRLSRVVAYKPDIVIIELGANDALRGLQPSQAKQNLKTIITGLRDYKPQTEIILAGMQAPANMGATYNSQFNPIYQELADEFDLHLFPFFLKDVALQPELNLADGVHPNPKGIAIIVKNILPTVEKTIDNIN